MNTELCHLRIFARLEVKVENFALVAFFFVHFEVILCPLLRHFNLQCFRTKVSFIQDKYRFKNCIFMEEFSYKKHCVTAIEIKLT